MNLPELRKLASSGESEKLEFKKSTGDLKGGMETLCGFLNAKGGKVLFGVGSSGRLAGQTISDNTLREVANEITKLDPPATISQMRISVSKTNEVLVLETTVTSDAPYTSRRSIFRRIASATTLRSGKEGFCTFSAMACDDR